MPVTDSPLRLLMLCSALALLTGCASITGGPEFPTAIDLRTADPLYGQTITAFYTPGANQKAERNKFINIRSALIDRTYDGYKQRLHAERVSSAVGADMANLTLGSIAAGASAASVKTAAGALIALITGGKASVDKNVYFDRALPAMLSQMEAKRAEIRHQILNGMQMEPERYSLEQARDDLQKYFDAGTITGAITEITTTAVTRQQAAEDKLERRSEAELTRDLTNKGFTVMRASKDETSKLMKRCLDRTTGLLVPAVTDPVSALFRLEGNLAPSRRDMVDLIYTDERKDARARLFASEVVVEQFKQCPPNPLN